VCVKTSVYERVRGLVGRLLDDDDMRHWYIHADKIVLHPNYTNSSQNQLITCALYMYSLVRPLLLRRHDMGLILTTRP